MKKIPLLLLVGALAASLFTACQPEPKSGSGFTLPEGDVDAGKEAFVALRCYTCHTVNGVNDLPAPSETVDTPVVIGGEVARVKTYGDLLTAIVHPSHQITGALREQWTEWSQLSPMPDYGDAMTVRQMIDLTTFLQPRYIKLEPLYTPYYIP